MVCHMEKNCLKISIGDMIEDEEFEDYPEETVFILDDEPFDIFKILGNELNDGI